MHKEEFFNTLIGDEFISALIAQVKTIFKHIKIEEINLLIAKIEEGICSPKKEMTRFSDFLIEKLKSFIESDFFDDEDENLNLNHSNISEAELTENIKAVANNINSNNIVKNCCDKVEESISVCSKNDKNDKSDKNVIYYASSNKKISFSMSTQIINEKPTKIGNDVGLDELLEYIAADENPKKTNKKKGKKKKNAKGVNGEFAKNNKNGNIANNGGNNSNTNKKSTNSISDNHPSHSTLDQEVETFKNTLKIQNNFALGKKIKPNLSQEWLNNILNMVNASQ
jgi:hypothetical protein